MFFASFSQRFNKVNIANNGMSTSIVFLLDQNVLLTVNQDGTIGEWGVDKYADRGASQNMYRKLDPFDGKVDYYSQTENEAFRGKIKCIGRTLITYYSNLDKEFLVGKIKSIGSVKLDYFSNYDDVMLTGKLKSAGSMNFNYFSSFENEAIKGKLKTAGTVNLTYFSSVDDKSISGKVKTLNGNVFTYATTQEPNYSKGSLKAGMMTQMVNGILYSVRN